MVASPGLDQNIILSLSNSLETIPSFDEQLKNLDKNGDGRLTPDEFGTDENARVLETFGGLYGNRNGIVEREEWAQVWQQWVGRPAATAVRVVTTKNRGIETEKAWSYFRNVPRVASPILYQGVAYLLANGGILTALDAKTGTLLKTGRLTGALDNYFASPVASSGTLYLTSETGKIVAVKAGADWEVIAVNDLGEECYATPALSKGDIFIRTANTLYRFRATMKRTPGRE